MSRFAEHGDMLLQGEQQQLPPPEQLALQLPRKGQWGQGAEGRGGEEQKGRARKGNEALGPILTVTQAQAQALQRCSGRFPTRTD